MAKGFARLGIIPVLLFINPEAHALTDGALAVSGIKLNLFRVFDLQGAWFELIDPARAPVDQLGDTIGDDGRDRLRIETDLPILPDCSRKPVRIRRYSSVAGRDSQSSRLQSLRGKSTPSIHYKSSITI